MLLIANFKREIGSLNKSIDNPERERGDRIVNLIDVKVKEHVKEGLLQQLHTLLEVNHG